MLAHRLSRLVALIMLMVIVSTVFAQADAEIPTVASSSAKRGLSFRKISRLD